MGWWSTDIMGGDEPLDIKSLFEDEFGTSKMYTGAITFMESLIERGCDAPIVKQVVGFLIMQNGYPMSSELRATIIRGIDDEDLNEWNNQNLRWEALTELRGLVNNYPNEGFTGSSFALPHQTGLFEKMTEHLS